MGHATLVWHPRALIGRGTRFDDDNIDVDDGDDDDDGDK